MAEHLTYSNLNIVGAVAAFALFVWGVCKLFKKPNLPVLFVCQGTCKGLYNPEALEILEKGGMRRLYCVNCAAKLRGMGWRRASEAV